MEHSSTETELVRRPSPSPSHESEAPRRVDTMASSSYNVWYWVAMYTMGVSLFAAFLIASGFLFHLAEREQEEQDVAEFATLLAKVDNASVFTSEERAQFITFITRIGGAPVETGANWDMAGSVFFFVTLSTTIGYGSYTPQTTYGRTLVIVLGVVGIGVMGALLTIFADAAIHMATRVATRCCGERFAHPDREGRAHLRRRFQIVFSVVFFVALLLVGAALFAYLEEWTFSDGFYFAFVTLTTVGFGDLVPSRSSSQIFGVLWILLGLGIATIVMRNISNVFYTTDEATDGYMERFARKVAKKLSNADSAASREAIEAAIANTSRPDPHDLDADDEVAEEDVREP